MRLLMVSRYRAQHGLATVVDSMWESIHALRCGLLVPSRCKLQADPVKLCVPIPLCRQASKDSSSPRQFT
ncbi:hypothetical protein GBAR_LOCUS12144 [Geodia barretti]|uniref:Uncharacterized protein n=1 Tax=Geodia barretti TaxID=519541 RepID=A0AA35S1G2_GEOBA|nr:hypothetical protein GBAR_LOCUS12144 [Geodia barretti]